MESYDKPIRQSSRVGLSSLQPGQFYAEQNLIVDNGGV